MDPLFFVALFAIMLGLLVYGFWKKSGLTAVVGALLLIILSSVVIGEGITTVYKSQIVYNDQNQMIQVNQVPDQSLSISGYNSGTVNLFGYLGIALGLILFVYIMWQSFSFKR